MNIRKFLNAGILAAFALLAGTAQAAFDPVHEDIDVFMTNPAISSERPNVLVILDTTANWSSYFAAEKSALISVIGGLNESFNVGLMLFTGGSIDGAYIRYAIRQMNSTNKAALLQILNNLNNSPATSFTGDKTNNGVPGQAMVEAYRYFRGLSSYSASTHDEHDPRTDYSGNASNSYITSLAGNAFSSTPAVATNYTSPVSHACQKNFIIYISNGKGSNQIGEKTTAKTHLDTAYGSSYPTVTPLSPSGNETDSWFDEWAKFLANKGFSMSIGGSTKTITASTYVVEINPGTAPADQQWTATLVSGSLTHGKGNYYATTDGDPGNQLTKALTNIFTEIQAVNSVFASTTLPVSVNVRGTNLNQVYIGMFRPDADKAPRWFGNLKLYKLGMGVNNQLQLTDANNAKAESPTTGFVTDTAKSHWTRNSSFWSYREDSENGTGGDSDAPDGSLVEKGGVAQQIREAYAASQAARKLYTCTGTDCAACTPGDDADGNRVCTGGSSLSATPFSTDNDDITATSLGLGTKAVATLTAKVTKSVSAITDRRNVSLSNAAGASVTISALNNGATLKAITDATAFDVTKQRSTTSLTGVATSMAATSVAAKSSSGTSVTLSFSTTGFSSNPCSGKDYITVAGNDPSVNGNWSITATGSTSSPSRYTVTFSVSGTATPDNQGTLYCSARSTVATATVGTLPAGLTTGSRINISGAAPTAFNGDFTVTGVSGNTFTYTLPSSQGAATTQGTLKVYNTVSGGSYSAAATSVRVTVSAASHGFAAGNSVVVTGMTPSAYNGTVTVATAPMADSFTYDLSFAGSTPPTTATVLGSAYKGASTTVDVTVATNALNGTNPIDITGTGSSCFDKTGAAVTWQPSGTQFSYVTDAACAPLSIIPAGAQITGSGYTSTVTATLANHGFITGDNITIDDGTQTWHRGNFTITGTAASTFTYTNGNGGSAVAPAGQYTVRLTNSPRAYVTATSHGFSTNDSITIAGASPSGYNGTKTITSIDADTFSFVLASAPGVGSGSAITASKNTTKATAYSVNHNFATGASVEISGASPSDFNGTFTIVRVDGDTFTYTLGSAQGDASGTIVAASGSGSDSERESLIRWVRGEDNATSPGGENNNGSLTDCRASVHGDVLHSRPAVINYNRYGGDNDVYVFYGSNDGVFRAIKGGTANDASDPTTLQPGQEAWGFVPPEGFTYLQRLRNNSPKLGSANKKPYFMDGPIGVLTVDGNNDGQENSATASDKVYLYVAARRGGRYLYSLDVTNPTSPKYRWKIDNQTTGFGEIGQTWSRPTVVTRINGHDNPVLIFGGGYDPTVEDPENCTIQSASATQVKYYTGSITYTTTGCTKSDGTAIAAADTPNTTISRSMGRAIYVVDAITGELVWSASGSTTNGTPTLQVSGMNFSIAADPIVIRNESGGNVNRAYFGDTGGNVWRFDFGSADKTEWTVTKLASLADLSTSAGRRKFLYPPDVVGQSGYDAVLIGSGDREHPFDMSVTNRFYMLKDKGNDEGPLTGVDNTEESENPTITEARLYNASSASTTTASATATDADKDTATAAVKAGLLASDGWYVTFAAGEKDIGNAVSLGGLVFFNTNVSPMSPSVSDASSCESNLGIANQYQVGITNAFTQVQSHAGGGFLPSPVHVVVTVDVTTTDPVTGQQVTTQKTVEAVISGTGVQTPSGVTLGNRSRRFWYKEID